MRVYIPHPYNEHKGLDPCLFYAHLLALWKEKEKREREGERGGGGEKEEDGEAGEMSEFCQLLTLLCIVTCNEVQFKDF